MLTRRRDRVLVSSGLERRVRRRQKCGGEVLIVDAGEGEHSVGVDGTVLGGLGGVADQFVLLEVVMDGGLLTRRILHRHVAEAAAPLDQMGKSGAIHA